jgi:hypothetical protein
MDNSTMIAALTSAGIPADTEVFENNLTSLTLESNGNLVYNFLSQGLRFDTTNDLVLVKEYFFKLASSEFYRVSRVSSGQYVAQKDLEGRYSARVSPIFKKFRSPKSGDIAFTTSAAGVFQAAASISSFNELTGEMVLSSDLDISAGRRFCYADGSSLKIEGGSIVALNAGESVSSFLSQDSILIVRKPVTDSTSDVILSFKSVEGFVFRRYNTVESLLQRG